MIVRFNIPLGLKPDCPKSERAKILTGLHSDFGALWYSDFGFRTFTVFQVKSSLLLSFVDCLSKHCHVLFDSCIQFYCNI